MEAVVLHRVGFLAYPCPKQGQDFKPSAAPLYPNMGQVPPRAVDQLLQGMFSLLLRCDLSTSTSPCLQHEPYSGIVISVTRESR